MKETVLRTSTQNHTPTAKEKNWQSLDCKPGQTDWCTKQRNPHTDKITLKKIRAEMSPLYGDWTTDSVSILTLLLIVESKKSFHTTGQKEGCV